MRSLLLAPALLLAVLGPTSSPIAAGTPFQTMLERVLPGMGSADVPARQAPQQEFQAACRALASPERGAERAEACRLIVGKLGSETPNPARVFMLRQLRVIGQAECVDAVAKLLADKDVEVKTWACWVLQSNPAPEANASILAALRVAESTDWRVTLIHALASRAAPESVDVLIGCLADRDDGVSAAAAGALGRIGTPKAVETLLAAVSQAPPGRRRPIGDACIRAAERLAEQGQPEQARGIYRKLDVSEQPRPVRLAARQGLLNLAGDAITAQVLEMLASGDPDSRALAAGHLATVRDENVWRQLTAKLSRMPPDGQVLFLDALAARGDKSVVAAIHAAANSENPAIRVAAIRALAKVGDASSVPLLVGAILSEGRAGAAGRESLHQVFGQGVEESLVAAMKGAGDERVREQLIDVLDARNAVIAVPAIVEECRHPSPAVRNRAAQALGRLAEVNDLAPVIRCLFAASDDADREAMEKAIVSICARIDNEAERADPVMQFLQKGSLAEQSRLLPVVGRIGAAKTLPLLRQTAASGPPELRDAAAQALSNWPRAEVADDLIRIARTSDRQPLRIRALLGYTRVIAVPGSRPPREMLAAFQGAMALAERDQERSLILTRATTARDVETLRWVATYLSHPALAQAACRAAVELAHHRELVKEHRAEFMAVLEKVIHTAKDATLVDRARLYMQQ